MLLLRAPSLNLICNKQEFRLVPSIYSKSPTSYFRITWWALRDKSLAEDLDLSVQPGQPCKVQPLHLRPLLLTHSLTQPWPGCPWNSFASLHPVPCLPVTVFLKMWLQLTPSARSSGRKTVQKEVEEMTTCFVLCHISVEASWIMIFHFRKVQSLTFKLYIKKAVMH